MKIAFIIFDGITHLDFIGVYDPISRLKVNNYLPDLEWDICAMQHNVSDRHGLIIQATKVKPHLGKYDAVIIAGGLGTRHLHTDEDFIEWIKTAEGVPLLAAVCTGSLLLGAAGFLTDKVATTNPVAYEMLKPYCKTVVRDRIVVDGNVITAGAVASSIDLGLYLCRIFYDSKAQYHIADQMAYKVLDNYYVSVLGQGF